MGTESYGAIDRGGKGVRYDPEFAVLDETDDFIVVDKPAPLQVHPSVPGNPPTLLDGLWELLAYEMANGGKLSIINRLDRETSGVVIVAKHREAARELHTKMERREVSKEYVALVHGHPAEDAWTVDAPLRRIGELGASRVWVKRGVHESGVPARTRFAVVARAGGDRGELALVRALPETGRMHQIRVHLEQSGFPIVGDKLYGRGGEDCYFEFIETGWTDALARRLLLPRQALHCARMEVPGFGAWEAPVPGVFASLLESP